MMSGRRRSSGARFTCVCGEGANMPDCGVRPDAHLCLPSLRQQAPGAMYSDHSSCSGGCHRADRAGLRMAAVVEDADALGDDRGLRDRQLYPGWRPAAAGRGWRAQGGTVSIHQANPDKTGVGYDYVHSMVDDHSRLAYSEILPDEKGPTCAGFLTRGIAYFADHGITRIERLITDNAWAYRYRLPKVCAELGITQKFIRPHCPWQNGKVERLNRTLATEWAYRQPFTNNQQRAAALAPWLEHYNTERRHSALGGQPPISRLLPT